MNGRIRWMALLAVCAVTVSTATRPADAALRVVTYNIDDDTGNTGNTGPRTPMSSLATVLQAIGNHTIAGNAEPIDVLALQELHYDNPSPSASLSAIVTALNGIYGAGTYAYDTFVGATTGNLTGNGPNGLVYNTKTVSVVSAVGLGTVSGSLPPRQPIRYKLHPKGFQSAADFYVYVSHTKAAPDTPPSTSIETRRNIEAQRIRADADALGASAHALYVGDWNLAGQGPDNARTQLASQEPAWLTLLAPGAGKANDISGAPSNWDGTAAFSQYLTWSNTSIDERDDLMLVNDAVLNQNGLQYLPNSWENFGNNGSTAYLTSVDQPSNTALADLPNRTTVLNLLTQVSDHLPLISDYQVIGIATPEPASLGLLFGAAVILARRQRTPRARAFS